MNSFFRLISLSILSSFLFCSSCKFATENQKPFPNEKASSETASNTNKDPESELTGYQLQDVAGSFGDINYKFRMPCNLGGIMEENPSNKIGQRVLSEEKKCKIGRNLVFSVTSKKSIESLKSEFESLKKGVFVTEGKLKGLRHIDVTDWKDSTIDKSDDAIQTSRTYKSVSSRNRNFLLSDKWILTLQVSCESIEKEYCSKLFDGSNPTAFEDFFDSFELVRK
jgi:hypothetical protein